MHSVEIRRRQKTVEEGVLTQAEALISQGRAFRHKRGTGPVHAMPPEGIPLRTLYSFNLGDWHRSTNPEEGRRVTSVTDPPNSEQPKFSHGAPFRYIPTEWSGISDILRKPFIEGRIFSKLHSLRSKIL